LIEDLKQSPPRSCITSFFFGFSELRFLQQELFTDVTTGDNHRVDLLAEVGLQGEDGLIFIHIENQAQFQSDFAKRMFIYFARLYQNFQRNILPIAVLTGFFLRLT
jgi:hypothetical protein